MKEQEKLGTHVIIAIGISYIGFFSSFIGSVLIARILGVDGKGLFSLFLVTVNTVAVFSGLGFGHGQMYHISKDSSKKIYFMRNSLALSFYFGGGIALLYFSLGTFWNLKIVTLLGWPATIAALFITPMISMLVFQRQYFLSIHNYKISKMNLSLTQVIPLLLYVFLYFTGKATVENMVIAYGVSQFICFLIFHVYIWKISPWSGKFSLSFAKESFSFGIWQYLSDLVIDLATRLDFFLVIWFLGKSSLGIYSVAVSFAEIASRLPSELGTILFPIFASGRIKQGFAVGILRKILIISVILAIILLFIGGPIIIALFGRNFAGSVKTFYWLLPGMVAWSTIYVTWNHTSAAGRPGLGIPIFFSAAFLGAILNCLLLPRMGVLGASVASTISRCLAALLFLKIFCKNEACTLKDAITFKKDDFLSLVEIFREMCRGIAGRASK